MSSKRRKPLILRGARQVGKTYSVIQFGRERMRNVVHLNLEKQKKFHAIFEGDLAAERMIPDLEVMTGSAITSGETLLFIDEIQACPRAITALRYFYEEKPELHVIAAGSLLEFAMGEYSFPVGRVQMLWMRPLSFVEFLMATGKTQAAELIQRPPEALSTPIHDMLLDELKRYFFVGGMPEAVSVYARTGSMKQAFDVHAEICSTYRQDFARYRPHCDADCLDEVLASAARSVGSEITYTHLAPTRRQPVIKKAFNLLNMALVLSKVQATSPSGLPLGAQVHSSVLKSLVVDIGIMNHLCGLPVDVEYGRADLLEIHRGAMAEQFVGQEMFCSQREELYYWSRRAKSSSAEVDYLAVVDGVIRPIEVKSGAAGRLRSLHLLLQEYPQCGNGIVLSARPYQLLPEQRLEFIPLYYAMSVTGGQAG